jgi:hypothetical protein
LAGVAKQKRKPASKPITSHQLFPAVVALWFGALFGLGSLAVRPSLLESVVMASRIDLVIPAAAPPLGVTARILLALGLAAAGSAIGLIIARRLSRPKPEVRERKRTKLADREEAAPRYNHHPVADEAEDEMNGGILAQRRRALTIEHDEEDFVPHEMAPLPGGAPQILDISKVGFEAPPAHMPLDLSDYQHEPARQEFQPQPVSAPVPQAEPVAYVAPPAPAPLTEAAQRQIFGQPVNGDHIDPNFVQAAGFKTTVFDTETPEPLFPPRFAPSQAATAPEAAPEAAQVVPSFTVPPAPAVEAFAVPPMEAPAFTAPEPAAAPVAEPEPAAPAPVVVAAPAEPLPSPAGLGMTDLASRLAESMARRRAARAAAAGAVPQPAETPAVPVAEQAPFEAAASTLPAPVLPEPAPFASPAQFEASVPAPFAPFAAVSTPDPAPQAAAPVTPISIPAAMRPLDLGGFEEEVEPLSSLLPPRHTAMPAAAPSAAPAPAAFAMPEAAPQAAAAQPLASEEPAEDAVAEDKFGSLLGLSVQPRAGLVRIGRGRAFTIRATNMTPAASAWLRISRAQKSHAIVERRRWRSSKSSTTAARSALIRCWAMARAS